MLRIIYQIVSAGFLVLGGLLLVIGMNSYADLMNILHAGLSQALSLFNAPGVASWFQALLSPLETNPILISLVTVISALFTAPALFFFITVAVAAVGKHYAFPEGWMASWSAARNLKKEAQAEEKPRLLWAAKFLLFVTGILTMLVYGVDLFEPLIGAISGSPDFAFESPPSSNERLLGYLSGAAATVAAGPTIERINRTFVTTVYRFGRLYTLINIRVNQEYLDQWDRMIAKANATVYSECFSRLDTAYNVIDTRHIETSAAASEPQTPSEIDCRPTLIILERGASHEIMLATLKLWENAILAADEVLLVPPSGEPAWFSARPFKEAIKTSATDDEALSEKALEVHLGRNLESLDWHWPIHDAPKDLVSIAQSFGGKHRPETHYLLRQPKKLPRTPLPQDRLNRIQAFSVRKAYGVLYSGPTPTKPKPDYSADVYKK